MTHLAFFDEPRTPRLSKLLQEIQRGEILIPRFLRPFVWTEEQRLALMDSIYSGYPIGVILVWRTQAHRLMTHEGLGPLRLPADDGGQSTRQYLLDGHQRMATLFAALGPGLPAGEEHAQPPWLGDDEERARWPIYFDLEAENQPFRLVRRRESVPPTFLPLDKLFDPFGLREFEDTLRVHKPERKLVNRVQSIAEIFRDYVIPVTPIATEDLAQITECFKRINGGGSSMSEVHMVRALSHGPNFDLVDELDNLATELQPVGWEGFDQQMILNICKGRLGLSIYDDAEEIAERILNQQGVLRGVRDDILQVANMLDRIAGVRGPGCLPYSQQAVLLADALREVSHPSKELTEKLRQWFWSTTLTEYFRGMTKSLFERARQHLHEVVAGQADPSPPDLPATVDPLGRFDFRGARSRAVGLLLAELNPVDPAGDGDVAAFDLLAEHGVGALSRLVRDREIETASSGRVNGPENRFLIAPRHAARLRAAIEGPKPMLDRDSLASHAISPSAIDALRREEWAEFLAHRRVAIEDLERTRAKECGLRYRRAK